MKPLLRVALPALLLLALPLLEGCTRCGRGCTYVETGYRTTRFEDLQAREPPVPLRLEVEFRRNGKHLPGGDSGLAHDIQRVIERSRAFMLVTNRDVNVLRVVADNIYDPGGALTTGLGARITSGVVTDQYEFQIDYTSREGRQHGGRYRHAIHTALGNAPAPTRGRPVEPKDAFAIVVEDVMLSFLRDLQSVGDQDAPFVFVNPDEKPK